MVSIDTVCCMEVTLSLWTEGSNEDNAVPGIANVYNWSSTLYEISLSMDCRILRLQSVCNLGIMLLEFLVSYKDLA